MRSPRITVGIPVFKGAELVPKALDCLQRQTYENFETIISVDGNDQETAAACRPFLTDPRFKMVVHSERLDWVGNFNWLLQQDTKEFFCYRQHDDTTSPNFFEELLRTADTDQHAAAVYCDCQHIGGRNDIEIVQSITGEEPLDRVFQYVSRLPNIGAPVPLRGLIRTPAIRQAGLVRSDEFRAAWQVFGWLTKLLHWGGFRRLPRPLYFRLDHAGSYTRRHWHSARRPAWTTLFTALLEAAMQICGTPEQRHFFQQLVLDRLVAFPPFEQNNNDSLETLVAECFQRVEVEENLQLLDRKELDSIVEGQRSRVQDLQRIEQSRLRRGICQIRYSHEVSRLIYQKRPISRTFYLIRHVFQLVMRARRTLAN